jgi:hypothetical protein
VDEKGKKRLIKVVIIMTLEQAQLCHKVTAIAADMTYKHVAGDMKVYRWTAMDPEVNMSQYLFRKKNHSLLKFI